MHDGSLEYIYVAEHWESALDLSTQALNDLREIFPEHLWLLTETGSRAVDDAMMHLKDAAVALHRAGRHVLGAEQYDNFMQERSERQVGQVIERGDT